MPNISQFRCRFCFFGSRSRCTSDPIKIENSKYPTLVFFKVKWDGALHGSAEKLGVGSLVKMGGLAGSLARVNKYSKKHCRSLFWRMKAALKKVVENGGKQRFRFQYDPWSYALNFDDGNYELREKAGGFYQANNKLQSCSTGGTCIYVFLIES